MNLQPKRPDSAQTFLPEDFVRARAEHRANFLTVLMYAVVMFAVVSAFLITNRRWESIRQRDRTVSEAYAQQALAMAELDRLNTHRLSLIEKATVTNALVDRVGRSVLIGDLESRRPAGVSFSQIELEGKRVKQPEDPKKAGQVRSLSRGTQVNKSNAENKQDRADIAAPEFEYTLTLEGLSPTNRGITDFMSALQESPLLEQIELEFIQETAIDGRDLRKFKILAGLRKDADARELGLAVEVDPLLDESDLSELVGADTQEQEGN